MKIIGSNTNHEQGMKKRPRAEPRSDAAAQLHITPNIEAIHIFSQVGSLAETSRRTGISIEKLTRMSRESWWQKELQGIQREQTAIENVRLSRMWNKTLEKVEECLENGVTAMYRGAPIINESTGEEIKRELNPQELAQLATVLFNQRQLVREQPTAILASGTSKLEQLAEKLEALGKAREAGEVIDVTPIVSEEQPDA